MQLTDETQEYYTLDLRAIGRRMLSLRFWVKLAVLSVWAGSAYYIFDSAYIQYLSDTFLYKELSNQPLTIDFLVHGARSPSLPILLKLFKSELAFVYFQLAFFYIAWLTLFLVLEKVVKVFPVYVALICTLSALSVSLNFFCWHKMIMSESVSLSGAVLLFAQLIRFVVAEKVTRKDCGYLLAGWIIWQFARDTNAYFSLFVALGFVLVATLWRIIEGMGGKWQAGQLVALAMLVFASAQISSINSSDRWKFPLVNVIGLRILPDEERTRQFVEMGMPMNDKVACFRGKVAIHCNADWSGFGEWFDSGKAKADYQHWLLMHFNVTAMEVFANWQHVWTPDTMLYSHAVETKWSADSTALVQPRGDDFLKFAALSIGAALLAMCVSLRHGFNHWLTIVLMFYVISFAMAFIAYHGDALDVDRHTVNVQLNTYLTGWILIFWSVSFALETLFSMLRKLFFWKRAPQP